jgi:hypothetical protein
MFRNNYDPSAYTWFPRQDYMPAPAWMSNGLDELQMQQDMRREWLARQQQANPYAQMPAPQQQPAPQNPYVPQQAPYAQWNQIANNYGFNGWQDVAFDDAGGYGQAIQQPQFQQPQGRGIHRGIDPSMQVGIIDPRQRRG